LLLTGFGREGKRVITDIARGSDGGEKGQAVEKGKLLISPVYEGKEPREHARKRLMQAA
jgi:hypothetical protein